MKTIFAIVLAAATAAAHAGPEIAIGETKFSHHGDGVWYQEDYGDYRLNLRSPTLSIGWTDTAAGLRWRAGYQYLGHYSTYCECTGSDVAYEMLQAGTDLHWPINRFHTWGDIHALYASVMPEWHGAFVEVGAKLIGASNKVRVDEFTPAIDAEGTKWGESYTYNANNGRRYAWTPVLGVGYRSGQSSIALTMTRINVAKGDLYPIAHGPAYTLEIRHEF